MNNLTLTIFTPTFNRYNKIIKLYGSLKKQSDKGFVWLVVDDGSNDNTKELFEIWMKEADFEIVYIWQENAGKSYAHNHGVSETKTELFTCVDSDDYLSIDAVEIIKKTWIKHDCGDVGILARREVTRLTKRLPKEPIKTTLRESGTIYGIKGDTMLIFRTNVLKKYSFPIFEGEKFVPENYLYDQIDKDGKLIFLDKVIYYGDYLEDGYTKNMAKTIKMNPNGYLAYIVQRISFDSKFKDKCLDIIRYIAISLVAKRKKIIRNSQYPIIALIEYPLGCLFYFKRYFKIR